MRRSGLFLGGLSASVAAFAGSGALAQDAGLRMVFGFENRFEAIQNRSLEVPATGTSLANVTALSFGLISTTELNRLEFNASGALIVENSDRTDGTEYDFGRSQLTFGYTREVPASILELSARYRSDDADTFADELTDEDLIGTRTDVALAARVEVGRTSPFGFEVGAEYEETDYQDTVDADLVDNREYRANTTAIFRFSEVATGRLGLRFRHLEEDDTTSTVTEDTTAFAGLDYRLTERLGLALELGYVESEVDELGVIETTRGPEGRIDLTYTLPTGSAFASLFVTQDADEGQRETFEIGRSFVTPTVTLDGRLGVTHADTTGTDMIGRIDISKELPDGSIGLGLGRTISFDADSSETEIGSVFSLSWSKQVNEVASFSLAASYEVSDAPSERIELATVGAEYQHQLNQDWALTSGIGYEVRNDNDGQAESPSAFVALSRSFEFRP